MHFCMFEEETRFNSQMTRDDVALNLGYAIVDANKVLLPSADQYLQRKRKLDRFIEIANSSLGPGLTVQRLGTAPSSASTGHIVETESSNQQSIHNSSTSTSNNRFYSEPTLSTTTFFPPIARDEWIHVQNSWVQRDMTSENEPLEDCNQTEDASEASDAEEESNLTARWRAFSLLFSCGDHLPGPVVPLGPRFQARIPEMDSTYGGSDYCNSESTKYLGTCIWPIEQEGRNQRLTENTGKGRPQFCTCRSRGSTVCIRMHVQQASLAMKTELGPAFSAWKLDKLRCKKGLSQPAKESKQEKSLQVRNYFP